MNKFYGNNIENVNIQFLLQATPFNKNTSINFSNNLKADEFFENIYIGRTTDDEDIESFRENNRFDEEIKIALNQTENIYSKVDFIHISGYGGCGKTTFVHHLLWQQYGGISNNCYILDFEGEKTVSDALIDILASRISFCFNNNILDFKLLNDIKKFNLKRFKDNIDAYNILLNNLNSSFLQKDSIITQNEIKNILKSQEDFLDGYEKYVSYLVFLEFFIELSIHVKNDISKPLIIVFDNIDSISDLTEEGVFVSVLRSFINDCNFFIGNNLDNEDEFCNIKISKVIQNLKIICFLTTRIVTGKKLVELEPDLEMVYGWVNLKMPENYYSHKDIIKKRINYYRQLEKNNHSKTIEFLNKMELFSRVVYKNRVFKRLFNGNYRYCVYTIYKIIITFLDTGLISESYLLTENRQQYTEAQAGATGLIISLLLNHLKSNNIYQEKLYLSECQSDNKISLSRIILTVIREKGGTCSFLDILRLLSPFFDDDEICNVIYALSESKRDCWRRLITFSEKYPKSTSDLTEQCKLFNSQNNNYESYSNVNLCIAGYEYLEYIVPHFEFMLSRHKSEYNSINDRNYQPLFSSHSLDIIYRSDEYKYRFEKKIDMVFNDVYDCCSNSTNFAKRVIERFDLSEYEFLNNSYFNYHVVNRDGSSGYRQSYESRLIFSHIGYIERYRRYLLNKMSDISITELQEINKRLVIRIKKYIKLYNNSKICCQTPSQNEAAKRLLNSIQKIENKSYFDFETEIETL
jgi:hypothetical protein